MDYLMPIYPEMISLGLNCEVRAMIDTWHSELSEVDPEFQDGVLLHTGNNFFDWNISHPWDVAKCIDTGFSDIFKKENLISREHTDGALNYVEDIGSGIYFHHTFSRLGNITDQATIEREYDEKAEKISYLVDKFLNILKSPKFLFFIRRGNESGPELQAIITAIKRHRSHLPFYFINVRWEHLEEVPPEVTPHFVQFVMTGPYGTFSLWRPIFEKIRDMQPVPDPSVASSLCPGAAFSTIDRGHQSA
jgi:hypothetical protein